MGPATPIDDDLQVGPLIAPSLEVSFPGRSYFAYLSTGQRGAGGECGGLRLVAVFAGAPDG